MHSMQGAVMPGDMYTEMLSCTMAGMAVVKLEVNTYAAGAITWHWRTAGLARTKGRLMTSGMP